MTASGMGAFFVEYRPIPGCSLYMLGSDRTVWTRSVPGPKGRFGKWRLKKLSYEREGWAPFVVLRRDDGRNSSRTIASLMREVFPPVDGDEEGEAVPSPRASQGSDHGMVKMTEAQVIEMRRLKGEGWTYARLARRYGVSRNTVFLIVTGRTWAHVRDDAPDLPDPAACPESAAPPPSAAPAKRRRGRNPIHVHRSLRTKPADLVPLELLEMPRRGDSPGIAPTGAAGAETSMSPPAQGWG